MSKKIWSYVIAVYVVCFVFRIWEYFGLRTDQTIIGEAFVHKMIGIIIMVIAMKRLHYSFGDIGVRKEGLLKYTVYGLLFGTSVFAIGYATEIVLCMVRGNFSSISFYVSSYAVDKNVTMNQGFVGFWHIIGPIRNYIDGVCSLNGMIANIVMLFTTSGLIGFKFAMLSKLEGALYMGMADHFVNNTIVNLLHVTTTSGMDELMFMRITVAQTISFIIVLFIFIKKSKEEKERA